MKTPADNCSCEICQQNAGRTSDYDESWRFSDWFAIWLHLARTPATFTICLLLFTPGCTTIRPVKTEASQPSFDQGGQDSGFIGWNRDGTGIITERARDRYNALGAAYGKDLPLPWSIDQGLTPIGAPLGQTWLITQQALVNFETMNRWKKEEKKP